jgi:glycosyltransferase involved in cell wall biosynthesis
VSLPSITVVTPCLNAEATIQQTIDSVAAQDYPRELVEHLVVDGGSTDATVEIVERAGLRYVSEPDRGLSDALNKGLAMATGDVFAELNADDLYLPGALSRVGRTMAEQPGAEWVTGPCLIVGADGEEIRRGVTAYKSFFLRRWSYRLHLVQNFVSAPATFVRTAALRELGGFDERFRYSMDYDVWLKLGRRGPPVVLDEPLAAFRMAGESLSLTGFERQFEEHALNAREHGRGHPLAVAANRATSRAIVLAYRAGRFSRRRAARR